MNGARKEHCYLNDTPNQQQKRHLKKKQALSAAQLHQHRANTLEV